jgi:hypothetical protein
MFYCPDRCYETTIAQPGSAVAEPSGDNATAVDNSAVPGAPAAPAETPSVPESAGENPISIEGGVGE